jgi:hypothetical protein
MDTIDIPADTVVCGSCNSEITDEPVREKAYNFPYGHGSVTRARYVCPECNEPTIYLRDDGFNRGDQLLCADGCKRINWT